MLQLPDGALVQGDGTAINGNGDLPQLYVVEQGQKRMIPDVRAFLDAGYDEGAVQVVPDADVLSLPDAPALEGIAPGAQIQDSLYTFLGGGHYMTTNYWLRNTGSGAHLSATTRTWNITKLSGFRGGVQMIFGGADGHPVGSSQMHSFGVDGTWFGRSDRTDAWYEDYPSDWANEITSVTVFQFWNPHELAEQVAKVVAILKPIAELIEYLIKVLGGGGGKTAKVA
jgi:hypothetical protein